MHLLAEQFIFWNDNRGIWKREEDLSNGTNVTSINSQNNFLASYLYCMVSTSFQIHYNVYNIHVFKLWYTNTNFK